MSFLEFEGVKKIFGTREVLSDVSFDLKEGEIFGLAGASGSGKSTLFQILVGVLRLDEGMVLFEGKRSRKNLKHLRKNTGFATQKNMLFEELTIRENSFYFGELYGVKRSEIKQRFAELIVLLGLESFEDLQARFLSGGMNKRANILVSLIHSPKLLILDEPTTGLDPLLRDALWDYIHKVNDSGTTILVTSHLLGELEDNCNRIAILKKGAIVAIASVKQYKKKYKNKSFDEVFRKILEDENI